MLRMAHGPAVDTGLMRLILGLMLLIPGLMPPILGLMRLILVDVCVAQDEVWICMELMATCLEKLMKRLREPIPECILGKVAVAVRILLMTLD